jgi:hypothetical protein
MDKRKLKRYEIAVYGLLLAFSIILGLIGDRISQETIKAITINLASELLELIYKVDIKDAKRVVINRMREEWIIASETSE